MESNGRFLLRAEETEAVFIRSMGEEPPCDGLILNIGYLADYPADHKRHRENPRALVDAAAHVGLGWRADPGTAALTHHNIATLIGRRAANNPYVRAVQLPLTVEVLQRPGQAENWVEAGTEAQLSALGFAAPYIEVDDAGGPELAINCELIRLAAERSSDGEVVSYLQLTKQGLLDGTAKQAALEFLAAGATTVVVRVRRFKPEEGDEREALAYMELVEAISGAAGRAVADCVGRLGPALIPAGAYAFATNARRFRKLPDALASRAGGGNPPMPWEVAGQMYHLTPGNLRTGVESCRHPKCEARDGEGTPRAKRAHNLHEFQSLARRAAREGPGFADTLSGVEGRQSRVWAGALRELQRRRRAA